MKNTTLNKRPSKRGSWYLIQNVFLWLIFGITMFICNACNRSNSGKGPVIQKEYILAFVDNSIRIRVNRSQDGLMWSDAGFPNSSVPILRGVGATSSTKGDSIYIFYAVAGGSLYMRKGLLGNNSITWYSEENISNDDFILSTPAAVYMGNREFIVAYKTPGNALAVRWYNDETKQWTENFAPAGATVYDDPTIVKKGVTIVLAWFGSPSVHDNQNGPTFNIAHGTPKAKESVWIIDWADAGPFQLSELEQRQYALPVNVALAWDLEHFYLGTVLKISSPYQSYFLEIFSSRDGATWNSLHHRQTVNPALLLGLAAQRDAKILAVVRSSVDFATYLWEDINLSEENRGGQPGQLIDPSRKFTLISNKP